MHGHTASAAPWGTACALSDLRAGSLRHEAPEPGVEKGISRLNLSPNVSHSPRQSWGQSRRPSFSPSVSLRAWIVNGKNRQLRALQLRDSLSHHGCTILSDCRWKFYSRGATEPGFRSLLGLLQFQQGEQLLSASLAPPRWCLNRNLIKCI